MKPLRTYRAYTLVNPAVADMFFRVDSDMFLDHALSKCRSVEPASYTWDTLGFVPPMAGSNRLSFTPTHGTVLITASLLERVLPKNTIVREMGKRVQAMLDDEGNDRDEPTRKELAQIKEEVVNALLPTSCIKEKRIPVLIRGDLIVIGATSSRLCERLLNQLRDCLGTLPVVPIGTPEPVSTAFSQIILKGDRHSQVVHDGRGQPGDFLEGGYFVKYVERGGESSVTIKDDWVCGEASIAQMDGGGVPEVMTVILKRFKAQGEPAIPITMAKVSKGLIFSAAKVGEGAYVYDDEVDNPASRFAGDVIVAADAAFSMINAMVEACGGQAVDDAEAARLHSHSTAALEHVEAEWEKYRREHPEKVFHVKQEEGIEHDFLEEDEFDL